MKGTTFHKKINRHVGIEGQAYYGIRNKKTKIDNDKGHYGKYPDTLNDRVVELKREFIGVDIVPF